MRVKGQSMGIADGPRLHKALKRELPDEGLGLRQAALWSAKSILLLHSAAWRT